MQLRTMLLRANLAGPILFMTVILYQVASHPEWGHPIFFTTVMIFPYQFWYYWMFRSVVSIQTICFINSIFFITLLNSVRLQMRGKVRARLAHCVAIQFEQIARLIADVNCFWRLSLSDYYLLTIPSVMIAIYVVLFVPGNRYFNGVVIYAALMAGFTLHLNNWVAAHVRITAQRLYRALYHRGIIFAPCLSRDNLFKVNLFTIYFKI